MMTYCVKTLPELFDYFHVLPKDRIYIERVLTAEGYTTREKKLDWNNPQMPKYIIRFGYYQKELVVCCEFYGRDFGNIFFDSEKTAQLAIDTFYDELIWYFTEYKDSL